MPARCSPMLTNDADGRFAIDANTGVITVVDGTRLDFEATNVHGISVRVTDQGGAFFDKNFTIHLNDVNEAPTSETLTQQRGRGKFRERYGCRHHPCHRSRCGNGADIFADRQCRRTFRHRCGHGRDHGRRRNVARLRNRELARHFGTRHRPGRPFVRQELHHPGAQRSRTPERRDALGRHDCRKFGERHRRSAPFTASTPIPARCSPIRCLTMPAAASRSTRTPA